jgi:hypothetical protein
VKHLEEDILALEAERRRLEEDHCETKMKELEILEQL